MTQFLEKSGNFVVGEKWRLAYFYMILATEIFIIIRWERRGHERTCKSLFYSWKDTVQLTRTLIYQWFFQWILLPPAYVVRGKVIFMLGNVCLFTISGWGGVPHPRSGWWGGTPSQVWMVGGYLGYPQPGLDGGTQGTPMTGLGTPHHDWMGYPPFPPWVGGVPPPHIASTCYAAGGMPLAFTQEDFLVK